jgi:hypothetical protein
LTYRLRPSEERLALMLLPLVLLLVLVLLVLVQFIRLTLSSVVILLHRLRDRERQPAEPRLVVERAVAAAGRREGTRGAGQK